MVREFDRWSGWCAAGATEGEHPHLDLVPHTSAGRDATRLREGLWVSMLKEVYLHGLVYHSNMSVI